MGSLGHPLLHLLTHINKQNSTCASACSESRLEARARPRAGQFAVGQPTTLHAYWKGMRNTTGGGAGSPADQARQTRQKNRPIDQYFLTGLVSSQVASRLSPPSTVVCASTSNTHECSWGSSTANWAPPAAEHRCFVACFPSKRSAQWNFACLYG